MTDCRRITDHKLNGLNEALEVTAIDKPGSGGACTEYTIEGFQNNEPESRWPRGSRIPFASVHIKFQNGPIGAVSDMNGLSNEALLVVLIDRMRGFQSGPFAGRENAVALTKLEEALMWLQKRTRERLARGVEGTLQK